MSKLNKYYQPGGQLNIGNVVVEDNEWVKNKDGQVFKVEDAPTHNDTKLITGNQVEKVPAGKGGVVLPDVESVISSTHENRNSKDSLYTYKDERIKMMPKDVEEISKTLNLPVKKQKKAVSPSKLLDLLIAKREKVIAQYKEPLDNRNSEKRYNSLNANASVLKALPTETDLYDVVFMQQELKKKEKDSGALAQTGGFTYAQHAGYNVPSLDNFLKPMSTDRVLPTLVKKKVATPLQIRKANDIQKDVEKRELTARLQRIAESYAASKSPDRYSPENISKETGAIGDKFRAFPNDPNSTFDEYLNPYKMIGDLASGVGQVPLNIKQGDYTSVGLNIAMPALVGLGAGIGAKTTGQFLNNIVNPLAGTKDLLSNLGKRNFKGVTTSPLLSNKEKYLDPNLGVFEDLMERPGTKAYLEQDALIEKQIKDRYEEQLNHPEFKKRIRQQGIEDFTPPKLTFGGPKSNYSVGDHAINISLSEARELIKRGKGINPLSIFDHELGHSLQLSRPEMLKNTVRDENGKFVTFKNEYLDDELPIDTKAQTLEADEDLIYPGSKGEKNYNYYQERGEAFPHLRETRAEMQLSGHIDNLYDKITPELLTEFLDDNPKSRLSTFLSTDSYNLKRTANIMNQMPAVGAGVAVGAGAVLGSSGENRQVGGDTSAKQPSDYLVVNPRINRYPFDPQGLSADAYYDRNYPNEISVDSNITDPNYLNDLITHENEHRNSFLRSDFAKMVNEGTLNNTKNTPPYSPEIHNAIGKNEELSNYLYTGAQELQPIVDNFMSRENQENYKKNMLRQDGGNTFRGLKYAQTFSITNPAVMADNTRYNPNLRSKFLLEQKQLAEKAKESRIAKKEFEYKYKTPLNIYNRNNTPGYAARQDKEAKLNPHKLKDNSKVVAPNEQWMFPNLNGDAQYNMVSQTNELIAGELVGLGVEKLVGKLANNLTNPFARKGDLANTPQNFKSEINWGNWNKEIPANSQLIKEYNAIEQTSKANGTWMKNSDGSIYNGTPEQFVQENSQKFKKAFKDDFSKFYRGGTGNSFNSNKNSLISEKGKKNNGVIFGGDYSGALEYVQGVDKIINKDATSGEGMLELLYNKSNKSINFNAKNSNYFNIPKDLIKGYKAEKINNFNKHYDYIDTNTLAKAVEKNNIDYININNIFDSANFENYMMFNHRPNNYLKSRWYNNGMFDMTNPNIYKSLLPIGVAASQIDNKQTGGYTVRNLKYAQTFDVPKELPVIDIDKDGNITQNLSPVVASFHQASGCVNGMCDDYSSLLGTSRNNFKRKNNLFGNAWNIVNNGFGKKITPKSNEDYQIGDIVALNREKFASDEAKEISDSEQHVGRISKIDNGVPYITHFINTEGPNYGKYFEEPINNINAVFKYKPSRILRIKQIEKETTLSTLNLDQGHASSKVEKDIINTATNQKDNIRKNLNLTNDEYERLSRLSYGIIGTESDFGGTKRMLARVLLPDFLKKAIKGDNYDRITNSLSEGFASIKESSLYNVGANEKGMTNKEVRQALKDKDYSKLARSQSYLSNAFNLLGIQPDKLNSGDASYKATMAVLSNYIAKNPDITDEELIKKYTGKSTKGAKRYARKLGKYYRNIDGDATNNFEATTTQKILQNATEFILGVQKAGRRVKSNQVAALRDISPLPINVNAMIADVIGTDVPITEKSLSGKELKALREIATDVKKDSRNRITYSDYKTSKDKNSDVSSVGFGELAKKIFSNPKYNLKTFLGQATIKDGKVVDTFDYNDFGTSFGVIDDLKKRGFNGYGTVRSIGRNYGNPDGQGQKVRINLTPKKK